MSGLYGNPYLNYFLVTAVELFAYTADWPVARSFPRRLSYIGFTLLGAVAALPIQITLQSEYDTQACCTVTPLLSFFVNIFTLLNRIEAINHLQQS